MPPRWGSWDGDGQTQGLLRGALGYDMPSLRDYDVTVFALFSGHHLGIQPSVYIPFHKRIYSRLFEFTS